MKKIYLEPVLRARDILIEGERIASIADSIVSEGCKVIDCSNFYALPGAACFGQVSARLSAWR